MRSGERELHMTRAKARLESKDLDGAVAIAKTVHQAEPSSSEAGRFVVAVLISADKVNEALDFLQDEVFEQPDLLWVWQEIGEICAMRIDRNDTANQANLELVRHADRELALIEPLRALLGKAQRWHALARHLERMIETSLVAAHQVTLHEELATILQNHLNDTEQARVVRANAEKFKDLPGLVKMYNDMYEQAPDDPSVINEVNDFLVANSLHHDRLAWLAHRLARISGPRRADLIEQIAHIYLAFDPPQRQPLLAWLTEMYPLESEESVKARIAALVDHTKREVASTPPPPPKPSMSPVITVSLAVAIGIVLGIVVIVWLASRH
jgi:hypothetical protein